ncbi:MAG: hypothetical protein JOZ25_08260 [Actinobacteria bacterium]|nr:hypothetical protein [Actinomycetota bacterium]
MRLGDRDWDPAASRLTVLEGRALDSPELALGQGWNRAVRVSRDVSAEVLAAARDARSRGAAASLRADEGRLRVAIEETAAEIGLRILDWSVVHACLLDGRGGAPPSGMEAVAAAWRQALAERVARVDRSCSRG